MSGPIGPGPVPKNAVVGAKFGGATPTCRGSSIAEEIFRIFDESPTMQNGRGENCDSLMTNDNGLPEKPVSIISKLAGLVGSTAPERSVSMPASRVQTEKAPGWLEGEGMESLNAKREWTLVPPGTVPAFTCVLPCRPWMRLVPYGRQFSKSLYEFGGRRSTGAERLIPRQGNGDVSGR